MINLTTPISAEMLKTLKTGDMVSITGTLFTARDAAHKNLIAILEAGGKLPIDFTGYPIYYAGPAPAKPGQPIGSVGPTTAGRMDTYAPKLAPLGMNILIAKGDRAPEVINALKQTGGLYFAAIGGAGARIAKSVVRAEVVAFEELGTEAIHKLDVINFPAIVAIDLNSNNIYNV
jgi:fumarate hydratase subunit beta